MRDAFMQVHGLTKKYKECIAVDNISFSVNKGEVFGLLGPNGAGKTTTIKMICGLLHADSGSVSLGENTLDANYAHFKSKIGLCPQEIVVWELLTCMEQLRFMGMSYGMSSKEATRKSTELLEVLGLWEKQSKLAKTLSGGMLRRLNIALALVHDPELVILDEPQAGLDPQSRILVRDFIRQLAKSKTVILTTHDMDEADRLSDRVAIIDHGRILMIDTPEQMKLKSGVGDVLQISIKGIDQTWIEKVLDSLPKEFHQKKYTDGCLYLGADNVLELIPVVNKTIEDFGGVVHDMTIRKRTLEDAFIAMTGRGLRE